MGARLIRAPAGTGGFAAAWRAELAHLRRSPGDLAFITVLPLAMLLVMAWLFSASAIRALPVAVVDLDRSADSRQLLRTLDASPGVRVATQPASLAEAFSQVRALQAFAVVYVPADFSRRSLRGEQVPVVVYYNASYLAAGQSAVRDVVEALGAYNARMVVERLGPQLGPDKLRPAPVAVQSQVLFNPARSYALFLLPLIFAAVLSLGAALSMTAALGREVRDASLETWLGTRPLRAVAGKLAPYLLLFSAYGLAAALWCGHAHGSGVSGSIIVLALGQLLFNLAGAGIALLMVGVLRDMGSALSLIGLSIGASLAFSSATFPTLEAPLFTRAWSAVLPLTAYVKLQMQQLLMGSPWQASLWPMATLTLIALVAGTIGHVGLLGLRRRGAAR